MKSLEPHQNIVRLLGCCTDREPTFVILEYVSGGKLQSFLRASRVERNKGDLGLTSKDLTSFVYQVHFIIIKHFILSFRVSYFFKNSVFFLLLNKN
jgi:serine/threonine protein kinase